MAKFHNGPDGPRVCSASVRGCPIGGDHFDSKEAAQVAYEKENSSSNVATLSKKKLSSNDFKNNSGNSYENYTVTKLKENFGHRSGVNKFSEPDGLAQSNSTWSNYPSEKTMGESKIDALIGQEALRTRNARNGVVSNVTFDNGKENWDYNISTKEFNQWANDPARSSQYDEDRKK